MARLLPRMRSQLRLLLLNRSGGAANEWVRTARLSVSPTSRGRRVHHQAWREQVVEIRISPDTLVGLDTVAFAGRRNWLAWPTSSANDPAASRDSCPQPWATRCRCGPTMSAASDHSARGHTATRCAPMPRRDAMRLAVDAVRRARAGAPI